MLAASSFAIRQRRPDPDCTPRTAMRELPPDGALLFLPEEPLADSQPGANAFFGRRPAHFHLERLAAQDRECFGVSRELAFRTAGRDVYVLAYLGRRVSVHTEILADRVLDSVAIPHPESDVLARAPYMGVSCGIPNSICLRSRRALRVAATTGSGKGSTSALTCSRAEPRGATWTQELPGWLPCNARLEQRPRRECPDGDHAAVVLAAGDAHSISSTSFPRT
jgi:hypothetical protein